MTRRLEILLALLYPFTLASIAAGFLAFVMIFMKLEPPLVYASVLWFYLVCTLSIYLVTGKALKAFGLSKFFLAFMAILGLLAVLTTLSIFLKG